MLPSHLTESHTIKKQSQREFFHHYQQFTLLIQNIDKILSGATSKNLEGNEIRKSISLLDQITRDLQGIGVHAKNDGIKIYKGENNILEKEDHGIEILGRWKRFREWKSLQEMGSKEIKQNGNTLEFDDVYGALSKILSQDKIIANQGIISLDTSIFHTPKKETRIISKGGGNPIEKVETTEKYTLFCDVFQNMTFPEGKQLSLQDCMIYAEQLEGEGRMRATPYKIIYIPTPIMQTWCISDEIGQAIYIYEGHPLLETIISGMKGESGEIASQSLIWKRDSEKMKLEMNDILKNGIQKRIEHIPTEDMKLKLWAQKALMEARDFLDSIGMKYLGEGKWDLENMKSNGTWKDVIGGRKLLSFPSGTWNKIHKVGNRSGALLNSEDVANMLVSIGYNKKDIREKLSDSFEWKEDMKGNEEKYKENIRIELEKEKYRKFLDSIGMKYLGWGKWDLENMKGKQTWIQEIGGRRLLNFPSGTWNKNHQIGDKKGILHNPTHIANMLVSIGYNKKDIREKLSDSFEWKEDMKGNEEKYKENIRIELEKEKYRKFLDSIGMKYLGWGKWDLENMKGKHTWIQEIGGRRLLNFPSGTWNKNHQIGDKNGELKNPSNIRDMLISIGYGREDIVGRISNWNDKIKGSEEKYKKMARIVLEKEKYKKFLDSIGMKYLGWGKWDLENMKGKHTWIQEIGGRRLASFPSGTWNKIHKVGNRSGALLNSEDVANMLISIGYSKEDIECREQKMDSLEWNKEMWGQEESYKEKARIELEKEEYKIFLDNIGMKYLGEGKWNLENMKGSQTWIQEIGGKRLISFPSNTWNKVQKIGNKIGLLIRSTHIASMLISIGYKQEGISLLQTNTLK